MRDATVLVQQTERMSLVWPLILVGVVGLVLILALANGPKLFRGTRAVHEAFWCPFRRQDVLVDVRITAWDAKRIEVDRCTAFEPPTSVTCDKACLGATERRHDRMTAEAQ
jgi:hypothetical protein